MHDQDLILTRKKRVRDKVNLTVAFERDVAEIYRVGGDNGWDVSEMLRKMGTTFLRDIEPILRQNAEQYERDNRLAPTTQPNQGENHG